jgi:uncharacterized protein (TIGR03435 family)
MTVDPKTGGSVTNRKRGVWTQQVRPGGTLHLEGNGTTMSAFADMLTNLSQLTGGSGILVIDMTGLQGHYNVAIDFSLADLSKMAQTIGVNIPAAPVEVPPEGLLLQILAHPPPSPML